MSSFAFVNVQAEGPTQDVTVPGFGDVVAAIGFLVHQPIADITIPQPHCGFCVGFWASEDANASPLGQGTGGAATDAVSTSVSNALGYGAGISFPSQQSFLAIQEWDKPTTIGAIEPRSGCNATPITDGLRLTWWEGPVQPHAMTICLIGGDVARAQTGNTEMNTFPGGPWVETIGWRPSIVFTSLNQGYINRNGPNMNHQFGACVDRNNEQFHTGFYGSNNQSVTLNFQNAYTDSIFNWTDLAGNPPLGRVAMEITPDGFSLDTIEGFANSTGVRYLAVDLGPQLEAIIQHRLTPPTATVETIETPGLDPEFMFSHGGTYLEMDSHLGLASGFGYGMAVKDEPVNRCVFQHYQDGTSSRTIAQSLIDVNYLHWLHPNTSATRHMLASIIDMRAGEYVMDFAAVQRTQYPWTNIVIGRTAAPPTTVRPRFWIT